MVGGGRLRRELAHDIIAVVVIVGQLVVSLGAGYRLGHGDACCTMLSKRKRAAGHHEETAAELLKAYEGERLVSRDGAHTMLRWLVLANTYAVLPGRPPPCPMDRANAMPFVPTVDALEDMEQAVATRVFSSEQPRMYLEYAAHFFKWWARLAQLTEGRCRTAAHQTCEWLSESNLARSLVVPDVRRGAIKIAPTLYVRAGEVQIAAAMLGGTRSSSATLQGLRTGEWTRNMHHTLMYGTLTDIYSHHLLDPVYFAIINGRYLGRLGFAWVDMVLVAPTADIAARQPWPLVYVHGGQYIVHHNDSYTVCGNAMHAYATWAAICIEQGGVIGGRYDVRKCTI